MTAALSVAAGLESARPVAPEWLFVRLYPAAQSSLDALATQVVAPVVRGPDVGMAARWFWLRYVDHSGSHIRLRVLAAPSVVQRVLADVERRIPAGTAVRLGVYEPELTTYGGEAGVAEAEHCFQVSSALCLAVLEQVPEGRSRLAVAAALMRIAVEASLPEPARAQFLRDCARYWRGDRADPEPTSARAHAAVAQGSAPPDAPGTAGLVRAWVHGLTCPGRKDGPQVAQVTWSFRMIHLTLNRLGVHPPEEAALAAALAARLEGVGDG